MLRRPSTNARNSRNAHLTRTTGVEVNHDDSPSSGDGDLFDTVHARARVLWTHAPSQPSRYRLDALCLARARQLVSYAKTRFSRRACRPPVIVADGRKKVSRFGFFCFLFVAFRIIDRDYTGLSGRVGFTGARRSAWLEGAVRRMRAQRLYATQERDVGTVFRFFPRRAHVVSNVFLGFRRAKSSVPRK